MKYAFCVVNCRALDLPKPKSKNCLEHEQLCTVQGTEYRFVLLQNYLFYHKLMAGKNHCHFCHDIKAHLRVADLQDQFLTKSQCGSMRKMQNKWVYVCSCNTFLISYAYFCLYFKFDSFTERSEDEKHTVLEKMCCFLCLIILLDLLLDIDINGTKAA